LLEYLPFPELAFTVDAWVTFFLDGQLAVITGCARTDITALLVSVNQATSGGRAKGLWRRLSRDPGAMYVESAEAEYVGTLCEPLPLRLYSPCDCPNHLGGTVLPVMPAKPVVEACVSAVEPGRHSGVSHPMVHTANVVRSISGATAADWGHR
jgi:hypothetical protein